MKAVIVDIRKKQAAALDESGRVVRIHSAGYELGQTIELHEVKPVRAPQMLKRLSFGVAAAVLAVMIGTGTAYATPYGTVTLDGDSAIEYTINCFDYVLDVKAADEEGEALLEAIDTSTLRHHRIDEAINTTVDHLEQRGTIDQRDVEIHIKADTKNEAHTEQLREKLAPVAQGEQRPPEPTGDEPFENEIPEHPLVDDPSRSEHDLTPGPTDVPEPERDDAPAPVGNGAPLLPEQEPYWPDNGEVKPSDDRNQPPEMGGSLPQEMHIEPMPAAIG